MTFYKKLLFITGLVSLISACSSDSGPSAAIITADNVQDLSIAATESAKQSVTTNNANFYLKSSNSTSSSDMISEKVREIAFEATSIGTLSEICPGGGSYSDNISTTSSSASGSITFNACDTGDGVISGVVTFSGNDNSFTITYNNVTITAPGISETLNATISCTSTNTSFDCTTTTSITGIDGRTYSVSNVTVSGNSFSGYNVSATVVDPTHGTISINATSILFNCSAPNEGRPSSGSITFTSSGKSGSVVYDSCSSYTVTLDGVANSYNW
ncbi:MAG: hypothetical protein OQK46_00625 [Gammaproteobacteria bacterium]|nr:hypothetical protein [Gammaproteobacteria bacterium]